MKILFIAARESDYLQDLTYHGLKRSLGSRVVELPFNWSYHFSRKQYPRNLGLIKGNAFQRAFSKHEFSLISHVIVGSAKPETFTEYLKIIDQIPPETKTIFVDGGDFSDIGGDLRRLKCPELYTKAIEKRPFDLIFKREYLLNGEYPRNVFPFPFSVNFERMPAPLSIYGHQAAKYKYEVSFWAVESHPIRSQALGLIENKFDCRDNGTHRQQIFKKYRRKGQFYLEELQRCKITLNFRGVGWDTLRYWEVPGVGGFMISQRPQILIPFDFEHGKEVVFCKDDLSDLIDLCSYYLKYEDKRIAIAKAALRKAHAYHSTLARARTLIELGKV